MRKPTFTIDSRAQLSTLSRGYAQERRPQLPSPVATPKRMSSETMSFTPPQSFIGDVEDALRRSHGKNLAPPTQPTLPKPASKEKTAHKWAARLGLVEPVPKPKDAPPKA